MLLALVACRQPISVDTRAPGVAITVPVDGAVTRDRIGIAGIADDVVGLQGVNLLIDGERVGTAVRSEDDETAWTSGWESTTRLDGDHRITLRAIDLAGNTTDAFIDVLTWNSPVDPGLARLLYPPGGATVCAAVPVEVLVNVATAVVEVRVDDAPIASLSEAPWLATWDAPSSGLGTHSVRAIITTSTGEIFQRTAWVEVGEGCDAPPAVLLTAPGNGSTTDGDLVLIASAQDDAGVVKVEFFVDDGLVGEDGAAPWELGLATLAEGEHRVSAVATDTAGQTATTTERSFVVDRTAPIVAFTSPLDGATLAGEVAITVEASDAIGLLGVSYKLDGVPLVATTTAPFDATWDTTGAPAGDHALQAVALDRAGNASDPAILTVHLDDLGAVDLADADARWYGVAADDHAGSAVAGAGDVDGDGFDDLIVGAPVEDGAGASAGAAYVVRGPLSGDASLSGAAIRRGVATNDFAGRAVAPAGDVDGDGRADVWIGADLAGTADAGAVYLVLSPGSGAAGLADADAVVSGEGAGDRAGYAISGGEDLDGDGIADLVAGAWGRGSSAGAVYLLGGGARGAVSLSGADARLLGVVAGDAAGAAVASVGDTDGDGLGDVIVGAYGADAYTGGAYLVLGGATGDVSLVDADARLVGEDVDDNAGSAVAGAGDVDGDGLRDLLVGAWGADDGGGQSGVAYLVLGAPSGAIDLAAADARLVGESGGDYAGYAVAGAGDVDADGYADVLVGAPSRDAGAVDAGAAYLVAGPFSGTVLLSSARSVFSGEAGADVAGIALAGVGDVDGDGLDDIAIGANRADGGALDAGTVYGFLGGGL